MAVIRNEILIERSSLQGSNLSDVLMVFPLGELPQGVANDTANDMHSIAQDQV
jgi:hypothetical protein